MTPRRWPVLAPLAMAGRAALLPLVGALLALPAEAAGTCALQSASGRLCLAVEPQGAPQVGAYATWKVRVTGSDGQPVESSLAVRGGMPAHGHGLPSKPAVRRVGKGDFLVEGLLFNMPGDWVVVFDAQAGGARPDAATYRLRLDR